MELIRVENLVKDYEKGVRAADGVSFSIAEGETLGLVGESGCGKTTVGQMMAGLLQPDEGAVYYREKKLLMRRRFGGRIDTQSQIGWNDVRTEIQMVFQDSYSSLNPRKHIYEILAQPMLYHKLASKTTIDAELKRLLELVGLPQSVLLKYPHEFSGGQRQRIGIAKALSLNPKLLICDEPVSALDVSIQAQILNLLEDLQKELGLTCLFIAHGLGAVRYVSDRVAVMYLGRIVEIAGAEEVFHHPLHPYTKALLAAVPEADPSRRQETFAVLQGEAGAERGTGCPFAPRCPQACDGCRAEVPQLFPAGGDENHLVACPYAVRQSGETKTR